MNKTPRFLDLYHAGEVTADRIDDFIDAWHTNPCHVQLHVYLGMTWGEYRTWAREHWLPSEAEHAAEAWDATWTVERLGDEPGILRVHPPMRCRRPCPVHWPTDHPLADAPMNYNPILGITFRRCPHDQRHPDPDDQQVRLHPELAGHECDGCCTARVVDSDFFENDEPPAEVVRAFDNATERGITRRRPQ